MFDVCLSKEKEQELIEKIKVGVLSLRDVETQTEAICLAAMERDGEELVYVKHRTEKICFEAVRNRGETLMYMEEKTPRICLEAVKQDGWALEWVKERSEEICLASSLNLYGGWKYLDYETFFNLLGSYNDESISMSRLLNYWNTELPSYRSIRRLIAQGEIKVDKSPYHVLERLYYQ